MTKSEAIYKFFSSFGLTCFPSTNEPEEKEFPWISYENYIGNYGDSVSITANVWYYGESEAKPNNKAQEIADYIGLGGVQLPYDGGCIWVKRGTPWAVPVQNETDSKIKNRALNITLEFF